MALSLISNQTESAINFTDEETKTNVRWGPKSDPTGVAYQQVPDTILESPHFQRALRKGLLKKEEGTAAELAAMMDIATQSWQLDQDEKAAQLGQVVVPQQTSDIYGIKCVGPNSRGTGQCDALVPVAEASLDERPPLCPAHSGMAAKFGLTMNPDETDVSGNAKPVWKRMVD